LLFDAFEIETLDYLLEIDAILPPEIVRVFVCTKFHQRDNLAGSTLGPDEAYVKCVDYIRERGLPQVEQLFALDESTINNLKRSIHDTYQRAVSFSSSRTAASTPTPSDRSNTTTPGPLETPAPSPSHRDDNSDDGDYGDDSPPGKENEISVVFSISKLFLYLDSAMAVYFPSYKLYLPGLILAPSVVLGLIALYRRSARAWNYDQKN
jgi:hypothetical protein